MVHRMELSGGPGGKDSGVSEAGNHRPPLLRAPSGRLTAEHDGVTDLFGAVEQVNTYEFSEVQCFTCSTCNLDDLPQLSELGTTP